MWIGHLGRHPERSRFSAGAKDLGLIRCQASAGSGQAPRSRAGLFSSWRLPELGNPQLAMFIGHRQATALYGGIQKETSREFERCGVRNRF